MKRFTIFLAFGISAIAGLSQNKPVLSAFSVVEIMETSSGQMNAFMLELTVSDPTSLDRLEVIFHETVNGFTDSSSKYLPIVMRNGKPELDMRGHTIAFEGNRIRFYLKVRDQYKAPYSAILIKGHTKANVETNELVYKRTH